MSRSIFKKILSLEKKRRELIENLFQIEEMVQGSFCLIHVKCGRSYCQCNHGKLHPHRRMSMRKDGKQISRAVPKKEYAWITLVTNNYREYRKIRKMLNSIEEEMNELLDLHANELVKTTSKGKAYLEY
jgi:hypothetical protein